jgi:hypothetical protein
MILARTRLQRGHAEFTALKNQDEFNLKHASPEALWAWKRASPHGNHFTKIISNLRAKVAFCLPARRANA